MQQKDPKGTREQLKAQEVIKKLPLKAPYGIARDGVFINHLSHEELEKYYSATKYLKNYFKVNTRTHPGVYILLKHIARDLIKLDRLEGFAFQAKDAKEFQKLNTFILTMEDSMAKRMDTVYKIIKGPTTRKKTDIYKELRVTLRGGDQGRTDDRTPTGHDRRHQEGGFDGVLRTKGK